MNDILLHEFFIYIKNGISNVYEEIKQKKKSKYENKFLRLYWEYNYQVEHVQFFIRKKNCNGNLLQYMIDSCKKRLNDLYESKEDNKYEMLFNFFNSVPKYIISIYQE